MKNIRFESRSREKLLYGAENKQVKYYNIAFKKVKDTDVILNLNGYTDLRAKK